MQPKKERSSKSTARFGVHINDNLRKFFKLKMLPAFSLPRKRAWCNKGFMKNTRSTGPYYIRAHIISFCIKRWLDGTRSPENKLHVKSLRWFTRTFQTENTISIFPTENFVSSSHSKIRAYYQFMSWSRHLAFGVLIFPENEYLWNCGYSCVWSYSCWRNDMDINLKVLVESKEDGEILLQIRAPIVYMCTFEVTLIFCKEFATSLHIRGIREPFKLLRSKFLGFWHPFVSIYRF